MKQQIVDETNAATLNFIAGHIDVNAPGHLIISGTSTFEIDRLGNKVSHSIVSETNLATYNFISSYIDVESRENLVISSTSRFEVEKTAQYFKSVVNLQHLNDVRRINKFLESVNSKLKNGGLFIGSIVTYTFRKKEILERYPPVLNWCVYTADFFVRRIAPKVWGLKKIYFFLSRGQNRLLSKAEILGRIYSCGFEIVEEAFLQGEFHFVVRKIKEPSFDYSPTYGPVISLKREGKGGKIINVYKLRTMHAYSEYLQEYVYKHNSLQAGGKFSNDFRVTTVGRILRKFWLDELPMLINFVKCELKLVGVRPLSKHYLSLYPEEYRERRRKYRPGLIPPFYVDLPKEFDEIIDSEKRFLDAYDKHPFRTNWRYFWKAFNNIVFKRARSK